MKTVVSKRRNPPVFVLFVLGSMAQCLGPLVHPLPATLKKEVRELEKVSLKLAKSECSLLFNGVCLFENPLLSSGYNMTWYDYEFCRFGLEWDLSQVDKETCFVDCAEAEIRADILRLFFLP